MMNKRLNGLLPPLPRMYTHCRLCECRLLINDEWHSGYCLDCNQRKQLYWECILDDLNAAADAPTLPMRPMHRDA